ncbi:hypothetical protein TNCV_3288511 [Trichonephila clavipes]|nr:hypothetical protein TNCV_3288511 [Trichonephila clavipes]
MTVELCAGSDGLRSYITNHSTTDSVCYAPFGVRSYHLTPFATELNVSKTSIASFTLERKLQAFAPPMVRRRTDMDNGMERHCVY